MNEKTSGQSTSAVKPKRGFLSSSLVYALGDLLTKGARFILIPYYIAVFSAGEIGQWGVLQAITIASFTLSTLGLNFATRKFYNPYQDQGDALVSTFWVVRFILSLPILSLLLLGMFSWQSGYVEQGNLIGFPLIAMALISGSLRGGNNLVESWLNIREEAVKYRLFTFLQFLTSTTLIIFLVSVLKWGLIGAIAGELIAMVVWTFISAIILFKKAAPLKCAINWREIITYSWPTLPHSFFMWGVISADRLILQSNVPKDELGIYEIGYSLASFLSIVVMGVRAAWLPRYFRTADQTDSGVQYGRFATLYFYIIVLTALAGFLFVPELLDLIRQSTGKDYLASIAIFRIVLIGGVGLSAFMAFNQPLLYRGKTGWVAVISGLGFALNIGLNLIFVPRFGIMAAAMITVLTYSVMAISMFLLVQRDQKIQWQLREDFFLFTLAAGLGSVALLTPESAWGGSFVIKLIAFSLFPCVTLMKLSRSPNQSWRLSPRWSPYQSTHNRPSQIN